jgi:HSP20 family molecular chaperone IbpA
MAFIPVTLRDMFWTDPFFESAWGSDFDLLRRDMLREHRRMWDRFGTEFIGPDHHLQCRNCHGAIETDKKKCEEKKNGAEKMETEGAVAERGEENFFYPWFMPPRRWVGENLGIENQLEKTVDRANQLMRVKEDDAKFEVSLDTHEFKPEELKVNVKDNVLTVEGKHETKAEDGSSFTSKHFFRSYTLPKGCQAETIKSNLSSDGVLMITAPKNPALMEGAKPIAIQMEQK